MIAKLTDLYVFIAFFWLLNICSQMAGSGHPAFSAFIAGLAVSASLIYIAHLRENQDCNVCNDPEYFVVLSTDVVARLIASAQATQYGSGEITVDQRDFEELKEEFDNQFDCN